LPSIAKRQRRVGSQSRAELRFQALRTCLRGRSEGTIALLDPTGATEFSVRRRPQKNKLGTF
jgi:hypothetical protein